MAPTRYFGPDFFRFLRELGRNNNREWFTENKARYEVAVQEPCVRFVGEMGPRLAAISPRIVADARPFGGSISRIYRDTRFSKDKSPYKTWVGVHFSHERAQESEDHLPGFFLHLSPGDNMVASGVWRPSPPTLRQIRDSIVARPGKWQQLRASGIRIEGESYARVPSGYDPAHRFAEDLKRKDFYSSLSFRDTEVTSPSFGSTFLTRCRALDPLNRFMAEAIGVPW